MGLLAAANPIVFILTADRAKAKVFYADVLGLPQIAEDDFATTYSLNGTLMRLTVVEGHVAHSHVVVGWAVADIAAASKALQARGVVFVFYGGLTQDDLGIWSAPDGAVRLNWFCDPDGNVLSLIGA